MKVYASALAFLVAFSTSHANATPFEQNTTRHALSKRDQPVVQALSSWHESGYFRQRFDLSGLSCNSVEYAFNSWPGLPGPKKRNLQCWAGGKWNWEFDVSTTNDQGGKCAAACAIDTMLLDTGEFCSNSPSICCYAGKCPS